MRAKDFYVQMNVSSDLFKRQTEFPPMYVSFQIIPGQNKYFRSLKPS